MSCCGTVGVPLDEAAPPLPAYITADANRPVPPTLTNQNLLVLDQGGQGRIEYFIDIGANML